MITENLNIPLQNDLYAFLFGCLALRETRAIVGDFIDIELFIVIVCFVFVFVFV